MLMVGDLIDLPTCQKELSVRLDSLKLRLCLVPFFLFFCFFFFPRVLEECSYCSLNSSHKYGLFHHEQCIYALFTNP